MVAKSIAKMYTNIHKPTDYKRRVKNTLIYTVGPICTVHSQNLLVHHAPQINKMSIREIFQ